MNFQSMPSCSVTGLAILASMCCRTASGPNSSSTIRKSENHAALFLRARITNFSIR